MDTRLQYYFNKWFNKTATDAEKEVFARLLKDDKNSEAFQQLLDHSWESFDGQGPDGTSAQTRAYILAQIIGSSTLQKPLARRIPFIRKWGRVAAAVLILVAIGFYWWPQHKNTPEPAAQLVKGPDAVLPGREGAVLTLANGRQVVLDSLGNGMVANENDMQAIVKNGQLVYEAVPGKSASAQPVWNTMSTPRGRQYNITLSDGTRVWLNAASAISFPVKFTGSTRPVTITGEAYFEVAHNTAMPFIVTQTNGVTVQVLGTRFNINTYEDEAAVKVTVLEGSVVVSAGATAEAPAVLQPLQQRVLPRTGTAVTVTARPDEVLAWKNGLFNFNHASLQQVMRQLSRWYDIDIVYENKVPDMQFGGEMSRGLQLSDVLTGLQGAGVRFRLQGKTLIVTQ